MFIDFFQTFSRSIILGSSSEFHVVLLQIPLFWLAVSWTLYAWRCVQWLPSLSTNDLGSFINIYARRKRTVQSFNVSICNLFRVGQYRSLFMTAIYLQLCERKNQNLGTVMTYILLHVRSHCSEYHVWTS